MSLQQSSPTNIKSVREGRNPIPTTRKTKVICQAVEENHKRPDHPRHCVGVGNTIYKQSTSIASKKLHNTKRGGGNSRTGDRETKKQGRHRTNKVCERPISVKSFSKGKEGQVTETHTEFKNLKQTHPLSTLQNGIAEKCKKPDEKRRLDDQNRSEGCLFHPTSGRGVQEIRTIFLERDIIPVHMPMLRTGTSPKNFHKTVESSDISPKENHDSSGDLSGRPLGVRVIRGGNHRGTRHSLVCPDKSRIRDKLGEVNTSTHTDNKST